MWTWSLENYSFTDIANQLPDAFTDTKKVAKLHIPAVNVPTRIDVPIRQIENATVHEFKARLKYGRLIGS